MVGLLSKKKSDDDLNSMATLIFGHVGQQFLDSGLISQPGKPSPQYLGNDAVFCDNYLLGIIFGLCKSLERRNQDLKNPQTLLETYTLMLIKNLGQELADKVIKVSVNKMMAIDQEFIRGTIDGYGEGLMIMSIQTHDMVLLRCLTSLKTASSRIDGQER